MDSDPASKYIRARLPKEHYSFLEIISAVLTIIFFIVGFVRLCEFTNNLLFPGVRDPSFYTTILDFIILLIGIGACYKTFIQPLNNCKDENKSIGIEIQKYKDAESKVNVEINSFGISNPYTGKAIESYADFQAYGRKFSEDVRKSNEKASVDAQ